MSPHPLIQEPDRSQPLQVIHQVGPIDISPASNDDDGGELLAHPWAEYSRQSLAWQESNPRASSLEVEAALASIARSLGI